MKRYCYFFLAIISFFIPTSLLADDYEYGLRFKTYPSPASEMTGLILEAGKKFTPRGNTFTMEFDMNTRSDNVFGTIFRIITGNGDNIDLMYNINHDDTHYPILVTGEYVHDIDAAIPIDTWIPVSISITPRTGEIDLNFNGTSIVVKDAGAKGVKELRIAFGHCPFQGYVLDDVASIAVKDIIFRSDGKVIRHWDLSVHNGDVCLDNIKNSPAKAINPSWLVDQYISWTDVMSEEFNTEPSITFGDDIFYMSDDGKTVTTFDTKTDTKNRISIKGGAYPTNAPSQMAYLDGLIAYNLDEHTSARLDKSASSWIGGSPSTRDHDYWNNAATVWKNDNAIVSFGGYGHYHFNNNLLIQYPEDHDKDRTIKINDITPRYGSAICVVSDTLYVFGGRGNLSGNQELSPKYYYDLYAINLRTLEVSKLGEATDINQHFILAEQMVYDSNEDCFYAFTNTEDGILVKISKDVKLEKVSLTARFVGNSQYSSFNIYLNSDSTKLYTTMIRSQVGGESFIKIKEMNWPPVTMQLLHQAKETDNGEEKSSIPAFIWIILAVCLAITTGFAGYFAAFFNKKKNTKNSEATIVIPDESNQFDFSRNSICFFGGFCVKDKNGNDITPLFTPNLKALAILLILNSSDEPGGISSGKINRTLWSYKPEESANNNRNVYISKLRGIFESMEGITISNKNKLWSIEFEGSAQCDWLIAKKLFKESGNEENIVKLLELLLRGVMLPNTEIDWLDGYKGDFSNFTIDFLVRLLEKAEINENLKVRVANTIFMHDFLNEEALKAKCRILYKEGKSGLAKATYDNFCKNYKNSLGIDYECDFKSLIS